MTGTATGTDSSISIPVTEEQVVDTSCNHYGVAVSEEGLSSRVTSEVFSNSDLVQLIARFM